MTFTAGMSDLLSFVQFVHYLPPSPAGPAGASEPRGSQVFGQIGCAACSLT
jgi:hypothetical protein